MNRFLYKWKRHIIEFFFPRQRWLTKKIPNHWVDKDFLLEIVIFESIKHFIEKEHSPEYFTEAEFAKRQADEGYPLNQIEFERAALALYQTVTSELPDLEKKADEIYANGDFKQAWKMERERGLLETKIMIDYVTLRGRFWT